MITGDVLEEILRQLVNSAFPMALIFAMSRFKCSRRTVWLAFTLITVLGTVINLSLIFTISPDRMKQYYALVLLVPSLLFLLFASKDKPSQMLFNFFTAINAFYLTSILSHFVLRGPLEHRNQSIWQDALIRGLIFSVLLFLFVRFLRKPYQFLADNMRKSGWRVFCVIPMLFFALVMFLGLYPHVRTDNLLGVTFLYVILGFVYYIIYQVFYSTYHLLKIQGDNDALKSQVQAMERQEEILRQKEEQVRIYRHDMRHYIAEVTALLLSGDTAEALRVLGAFDERNKRTELPVYCRNKTINAILAFYIQQAKALDIQITCDCAIPNELPVEAAELAMVFANALENAIHACQKLPDEAERKIMIRCVQNPMLVLEVANTYNGHVEFDENHLPTASKDGHGIGTRSILAFADKNNAILDYKTDAELFRLRVLINRR